MTPVDSRRGSEEPATCTPKVCRHGGFRRRATDEPRMGASSAEHEAEGRRDDFLRHLAVDVEKFRDGRPVKPRLTPLVAEMDCNENGNSVREKARNSGASARFRAIGPYSAVGRLLAKAAWPV